jgi:DNA polymerase elongation subunit (family B)
MPSYQFKLFEYDIREDLHLEKIEYVPGKDLKQFIIQMYGIDETGKTASIFVKDYYPFFYIKVDDDWNNANVSDFISFLRNSLGSYYEDSLLCGKLMKRHKLYGFDNKKQYNFIKVNFTSLQAYNKCKNLFYDEIKQNGTYEKKLKANGVEFLNCKTELYEAQIPPLLRLFHICKIKPSGWVELKNGTYDITKQKLTTCDYEFIINYKKIVPCTDPEKEKVCVPFKILSLDIEASSSHGDFPLAKKNYIKVATNIIDYLINNQVKECTTTLLTKLIKTAFKYDECKGIERVYLKTKISEEELDEKIEELFKIKPANHATYIDIKEESEDELDEDDEDNDHIDADHNHNSIEEVAHKKTYKAGHKNTESNILEIINDSSLRNTKILELTKCFGQHNPNHLNKWEGLFPEIEGDRVTFIGSTIRKNGEAKPYLRHCIVVNSCDPIENAIVETYDTEKEALLAWTNFIQKENPDIIIGYNHHGWDEGFMFDRTIELNCMPAFSKLSRLKNEKCYKEVWRGPDKPRAISIEENSLKIASGQYNLRYFHISGRMQIDFLNLFRREEQLPSYKLDYVSGHFIGDIITEVKHDNDNDNATTGLVTKNLTGLNVNDYIVIEEIGHSTEQFQNGKKFKVHNIINNTIVLNEIIEPDKTKVLRWCLGKDDIGPQDIFNLTINGGAEGRSIVGKYCLKDTELVHDLMRKNDTLTTYTEMSNLCWVPMSFLVFRGQGIKLTSYVAQKCREKNTLMPVIEKDTSDDGYEGAIVLPPKCNLYLKTPVACVDYSSLYPSSIISENISHDSKVWTKEYDLQDNLIKETGEKEYDNLENVEYINITYDTFKWVRKTPKGCAIKEKCGYKVCRFVQYQQGKAIMPSILEELLAARKSTKKQMKNESDPFMTNILDKRQLAIKVTANSLYGQTGAKTSTFYDKDIAASTTATGRKLLIYAKEVIEACYDNVQEATTNHGLVKCKGEYIYGDTDSVFFTFNLKDMEDKPIIGKKALEITIELAKKAGALASMFLKDPHDLEYEKTFLPFCLLSKKRYVGILYEDDVNKGKRKSMGIVLKRRDNAPIVKDIYGGVIDILMKEQVVHKAVEFVKQSLEDVVNEKYSQQKLIITKSLRSYYKNPKQIAHNVLAMRIGEREQGNQPKPGDRIEFIYIENKDKKALQGEKIETPAFIEKNKLKIDYSFYITNQIMKPLQQVFALILEEMEDFIAKRGLSMKSWKADIEKLQAKWPDKEKFAKKYEEFRCKEVKSILFDQFINKVKLS